MFTCKRLIASWSVIVFRFVFWCCLDFKCRAERSLSFCPLALSSNSHVLKLQNQCDTYFEHSDSKFEYVNKVAVNIAQTDLECVRCISRRKREQPSIGVLVQKQGKVTCWG